MMKGDLLVERGATRLQELADRAAARGDGIGEWLSEELRHDAAFLRKLKPSLVKARAKGDTPMNAKPEAPAIVAEPRPAPVEEQHEALPPPPPASAETQRISRAKPKKKAKERSGGPPPIVIVGAALVAGILLAKFVDWRSHAHPRD